MYMADMIFIPPCCRIVFLAIYSVEMVIKVIALGFLFGRRALPFLLQWLSRLTRTP